MPISGVKQPEIIQIDEELRLRKYSKDNSFALPWYRDAETLMLVNGKKEPYNLVSLNKMYDYMDEHGELYIIEVKEKNAYLPIGDVTFWQKDMPIVIGKKEYRNKGIGKKVVTELIKRGKELGYASLFVDEVYNYNVGSRNLFEGAGFKRYEVTTLGYRFRYDFNK